MTTKRSTTPRRLLTPVERYDRSSCTPLLAVPPVVSSPPKRLGNTSMSRPVGFLAAEQFHQTHRDDDVSNLTTSLDPANESDLEIIRTEKGQQHHHHHQPQPQQQKQKQNVVSPGSPASDEKYEAFPTGKSKQCDADATAADTTLFLQSTIQSIFLPSLAPKNGKRAQSPRSRSRRTRTRTRTRVRPRQEGQVDVCIAGTMDFTRRLGECMSANVDVHRKANEIAEYFPPNNCVAMESSSATQRKATEAKGSSPSRWMEQAQMACGDSNSVVGEDVDNETPLQETGSNILESNGQANGELSGKEQGWGFPDDFDDACASKMESCQAMDLEGTSDLRHLRLRLFQCDNEKELVPQARLARALGEVAAQDEVIRKLQLELQEARNDLPKNKQDETKEKETQDQTDSSAIISLKTEVVFLRSQLADANAELLLSTKAKEEDAKEISSLQDKVLKLQRCMEQSEEKIKILELEKEMVSQASAMSRKTSENALLAKLEESEHRIAALSKKAQDDQRLSLKTKRSLSRALEQSRDDISKVKNELFNNKLKLAQAESRAESLEHAAVRKARELSKESEHAPEDETNALKKEQELQVQLSLAKSEIESLKLTSDASLKDLQESFRQREKSLELSLENARAENEKIRLDFDLQSQALAKSREAFEEVCNSESNSTAELKKIGSELKKVQSEMEMLHTREHLHKEQMENEKADYQREQAVLNDNLEKANELVNHLRAELQQQNEELAKSRGQVEQVCSARSNELAEVQKLRSHLKELKGEVATLQAQENLHKELIENGRIRHQLKEVELKEQVHNLEAELNSQKLEADEWAAISRESERKLAAELEQIKAENARVEKNAMKCQSILKEVESKLAESERLRNLLKNERETINSELESVRMKVNLQGEMSRSVVDYYMRQHSLVQDKHTYIAQELQKAKRQLKEAKQASATMELYIVVHLRQLRQHIFEAKDKVSIQEPKVEVSSPVHYSVTDALSASAVTSESKRISQELAKLRNAAVKHEKKGEELVKDTLSKIDLQATPKSKRSPQVDDTAQVEGCVEVQICCHSKTEQLKTELRRKELEFSQKYQKHSKECTELSEELAERKEASQVMQQEISFLNEQVAKFNAENEKLKAELAQYQILSAAPASSQSDKREGANYSSESQLQEEIGLLKERIQEAEDCARTAGTSAQEKLNLSIDREKELADEVATLKAKLSVLEQSSGESKLDEQSLRQELGALLRDVAEAKRNWKEDSRRSQEELRRRKEVEVILLSQIEELKKQADFAGTKEAHPNSTEDEESSVARVLRLASQVTRRKSSQTAETNNDIDVSSPARAGPDDEPPISSLAFAIATPLRDNRSSCASVCQKTGSTTRTVIKSDDDEEALKLSPVPSVSTITCWQTQNDGSFISHEPSEIECDKMCAPPPVPLAHTSTLSIGERPSSEIRSCVPTDASSLASESSSILSPPLLSSTVMRELPEPVPLYPTGEMQSRPSRQLQTPSPLELVTQLKSFFEKDINAGTE
jgi:hypothetical protein